MNLIIYNCSPRPDKSSTTWLLANAFANGYKDAKKESVQVLSLNKKVNWNILIDTFYKTNNILFAFPIYVECVPGLLMEFLEMIEANKSCNNKKIGFIIHGGFDEAHQLRTTELYCEILAAELNAEYIGTLLKGGLFGLNDFRTKSLREKTVKDFYDMGMIYAKQNCFQKETITKFAAPEKYSKIMAFLINLLQPLNVIAWNVVGKKMRIGGKIYDKPYNN